MSLKFSKGGSQVQFSDDNKCCIPSCDVTGESEPTLPFYTFPSDIVLCEEWLNEIQFEDGEFDDLKTLHDTHVVCAKHFKPYNGGMKLFVEKGTQECAVLATKRNVSTSTQTYDEDWIVSLKEKCTNLKIICNKNIQCRMCACTSVKAISIYDKRNKPLNLEHLINNLLPIEVKPTDTKPLYICVQCLFKLRQFIIFSNTCYNNDKCFDYNFNNNSNNLVLNKNDIKMNTLPNSKVKKNNCDKLKASNHSENPKLIKKTPNTNDFIKKARRKHQIKILISANPNNNNNELINISNDTHLTNKVINIEFIADYVITHCKEWIHAIIIDNDQLKTFSQETINHVLEVIRFTMKKLCNKNSKADVLPLSPLNLDKNIVSLDKKVQTKTVIKDEKNLYAQKIETPNIKEIQKYACKRCDLKMNSKKSFSSYIKLHLPISYLEHKALIGKCIDSFMCHICGNLFETNKTWNSHYKVHLNKKRFCSLCDLQFDNEFVLKKHTQEHHKNIIIKKKTKGILEKQQKCPKCDSWLSSRITLREHMKTHLPIQVQMKTCPVCKKIFNNIHMFKLHLKTHGMCLNKCPLCPRSFSTRKHLSIHLYCHKITEPMNCNICHQQFKTITALKIHTKRIHQEIQYVQKMFTCVICKTVFTNKNKFKIHNNAHTNEEKIQTFAGDDTGIIQCDECNKYFIYKSRLTIHKMYYHNKQSLQYGKYIDKLINRYCKPRGSKALQYCCKYCIKRFSSIQRLNLHERTHGLDYCFQCNVCSKLFTKMSALKIHGYSHFNQKQLKCNVCGKTCKCASVFKRHVKLCQ